MWEDKESQRSLAQNANANAPNNELFYQSQQVLSLYPFASATPSTHVARHLSNLSISAEPPSYIQPSNYSTPANYGTTPMYYNEMTQLSANVTPQKGSERALWDAARQDAIRYVGDQTQANYYQTPSSHWNPYAVPSSYQQPPFAQSLIHHLAPYNSYPTPPPPSFSSSSSSLANALGTPPRKKERDVKSKEENMSDLGRKSSESATFFNDFLRDNVKSLSKTEKTSSVTNKISPPSTPTVKPSSPDPLRMGSGMSSPFTSLSSSQTTPKKRKLVEVLIESPSKKAYSTTKQFKSSSSTISTPQTQVEVTPRKAGNSTAPVSWSQPAKMQVVVEVTTPSSKPWLTPKRSRLQHSVNSSLGGYGSEDEIDYLRRKEIASSARSTGKKTGERDDRVPLEKFLNLVEDIFEAEDNLPPEVDISDLPTAYFSQFSPDPSRPLLNCEIISKLTKAISKIARPAKRVRLASVQWDGMTGSPRKAGALAEVDVLTLSRLLKVLERSVHAGEDLDPIGTLIYSKKTTGPAEGLSSQNTPTKANKLKSSKKGTPGADGMNKAPKSPMHTHSSNENGPPEGVTGDVSEEDLSNLKNGLEFARNCVLAADCCLALLTSDKLAKQLFSEDLITSCLVTVKNQLTNIIYPFVEAPLPESREYSHLLMQLTGRAPAASISVGLSELRILVGEIFQVLIAVFPRLNSLVCSERLSMPDSVIIPAIYISLGPFFVVDSGGDGETRGKKDVVALTISETLGSSGMRGLRLEALSLVRGIFSYHEDQRSWIIEEILSSLIKLSDSKQKAGIFRLRDGRSIRTVSALLLQLIQSSAHRVRVESRRINRDRQQQNALRRQDSAMEASGPFLDENDIEEIKLYANGLEAPINSAKAIVVFLTQRSGKGKSTKNSNEQEYRAIFDNLISDLLVVLFWPEWPAASLVLSILCKYMISSLDDVKSSNNDNNASKTLALDHLGVIAGRLRANLLKWGKLGEAGTVDSNSLKTIDEAMITSDKHALEKLIIVHQEVSSHLSKRSSDDQAYDSARELSAVMWGHDLAGALSHIDIALSEEDEEKKSFGKLLIFGDKIKGAMQNLWKEAPMDVFDNATQEELTRIDQLSEQIGTTQSLKNAFDPILNVIIHALDAPPVFVRTKALRALSQILTVDANVLSNPNVRHAIESHLLDSSPQVRDAAVELIGKYMLDSPAVAAEYYQKIAERIADTGLGVRKRVIKLLKNFYTITGTLSQQVDICVRLVLRMLDEDDTVRDLAVKSIEDLWFPATSSDRDILNTAAVIMDVSGSFKDRQSPLEDVLSKIVAEKDGGDASALCTRFTNICDKMIDGLVDSSDFKNFTVINCIRTVHLFTIAHPSVMSSSKAATLLTYLKNPTNPEETAAADYILKIYRASIPHMPKTSVTFGNELQQVLQIRVARPNPAAGVSTLQESVACLCAVVQYLTHDFIRLAGLLKSCYLKLQDQIRSQNTELPPVEVRKLHVLVLIVSLLGEHFDFDRVRDNSPQLTAMLNGVSKGPIVPQIYQCILQLYDKFVDNNIRGRLLVCLGFVFRAQPTLMTLESSATMMDAIFSSSEEDTKARLLKLIQDFLVSESLKHSAQEKESAKTKSKSTGEVNMEELVGNTQGFAESGVSSAVVQRYLSQILDAALAVNPQIQLSAVDILTFTIKQGLAHPLLSFPVIVALETSPVAAICAKAVALHTVLHHKHASLLNSGFITACRKSYEYQCMVAASGDIVRGLRMQPIPTALLGRWYALVREKRASRQEFLRAVLKVFELRDVTKTDDDTVQFARYMAENFASFDYRTQEEVLTVLKILTRELSETGALLVERISPGNLLTQLISTQGKPDAVNVSVPGSPEKKDLDALSSDEQVALMKSSCIIGIIVLLKSHLKLTYGLAEEKCQKFVLGKKSAIGDRPAVKKRDSPISWERMPFAEKEIRNREDVEVQKATFLGIWNEDGAVAEPEADEWE